MTYAPESSDRVDPGEYPAAEADLRVLFDRLAFDVPRYGETDDSQSEVDPDILREDREHIAYMTDPKATTVFLQAMGMQEELERLEENTEYMIRALGSDPKLVEELLRDRIAGAEAASAPAYQLMIDNDELLQAAGYPDSLCALTIYTDDATLSPDDMCAKRAMIIYSYGSAMHLFATAHTLMFEHYRGSEIDLSDDSFSFVRSYTDDNELDRVLPGEDYVLTKEVTQLNALFDLIEQGASVTDDEGL